MILLSGFNLGKERERDREGDSWLLRSKDKMEEFEKPNWKSANIQGNEDSMLFPSLKF